MFQTVLAAAEWMSIQPLMDFISLKKREFKAYRDARATVNELQALSDKELQDIGISRGMIHSIAQEQYNENLRGWV